MKHGIALYTILLVVCFLRPLMIVVQNQPKYFARGYMETKYLSLKTAYYSSQYVNKQSTGSIPDETLESFAGGVFLQGLNPILIVHDQPPLGRYIIALSIKIFDNENTIPVFLLMMSAVGLLLISQEILRNKFLALVPVGYFINEPIFLHKLIYMPLLEPIQFVFIVFGLYAFIRSLHSKRKIFWFLLTTICIGFVISIRYFIVGMVMGGSMLIYILFQKNIRTIIVFISTSIMSIAILLLSYLQTFRAGYSLRNVVGIQKYIYVYHQSAFILPFSFWDLFLFNRWHTWWGTRAILHDSEWVVTWPLAALILLIGIVLTLKKKMKFLPSEKMLIIWIVAYCLMLSFGYTSTRYFLPLIPFLYIVAIGILTKLLCIP